MEVANVAHVGEYNSALLLLTTAYITNVDVFTKPQFKDPVGFMMLPAQPMSTKHHYHYYYDFCDGIRPCA